MKVVVSGDVAGQTESENQSVKEGGRAGLLWKPNERERDPRRRGVVVVSVSTGLSTSE